MEVLNKINEVVNLLNELDDYADELPNRQSNVDQRISDIYHYVENTTMNSKNSYRVVRELKSVLLERRELKVDQSLLATFANNKARLNLKSNRSMLLADVNKENKSLNSEYNFRVYDEKEFKEKMEG